MPITRRFRRRRAPQTRRTIRRAYTRRRPVRRMPLMRNPMSKYLVHSYRRTFNGLSFTVAGGSQSQRTEVFNMPLLPNWSEFQQISDQVRLLGVKYTWIISNTQYNTSIIGPTSLPDLIYRVQRDQQGSLSYDTLLEYGDSKKIYWSQNRRSASVFFRPNLLAPVAVTGTTYSNGPVSGKRWLDSAAQSTPADSNDYMGLAWAIRNQLTNMTVYFDVQITYYFQLKSTR